MIDAPLRIYRDTVRPEWIDYNGHMNVAYYVLVIDHAMDAFLDYVGLGLDYVKSSNCSTFAMDTRIAYKRELAVDSPIVISAHLVAFDEKLFQTAYTIEHADEGWVSATSEWVGIHVNLTTRRPAPFPDNVRDRLDAVRKAHAGLERASSMSRPFGISTAQN